KPPGRRVGAPRRRHHGHPRRKPARAGLSRPLHRHAARVHRREGRHRVGAGLARPRRRPPGVVMSSFDDLTNRVVVITGGGSGIGAALARGFAREGAKVAVADIDGSAAAATASTIGDLAVAYTVDVADPDSVERLAADVYDKHGRVDVLFNNAGV